VSGGGPGRKDGDRKRTVKLNKKKWQKRIGGETYQLKVRQVTKSKNVLRGGYVQKVKNLKAGIFEKRRNSPQGQDKKSLKSAWTAGEKSSWRVKKSESTKQKQKVKKKSTHKKKCRFEGVNNKKNYGRTNNPNHREKGKGNKGKKLQKGTRRGPGRRDAGAPPGQNAAGPATKTEGREGRKETGKGPGGRGES